MLGESEEGAHDIRLTVGMGSISSMFCILTAARGVQVKVWSGRDGGGLLKLFGQASS